MPDSCPKNDFSLPRSIKKNQQYFFLIVQIAENEHQMERIGRSEKRIAFDNSIKFKRAT